MLNQSYGQRSKTFGWGWGASLLVALIGLLAVWISNHFGIWYVTPIVGFVLGVFGLERRPGRMGSLGNPGRLGRLGNAGRSGQPVLFVLLASWIAGLGGWGLPLVWQAYGQHLPVSQTAQVVSLSMGFGKNAALVVALTVILGFLLATVGAWLGIALRSLSRQL